MDVDVGGRRVGDNLGLSAALRSLAGWNRPLEVETVVLLTSDVVSNVVLHAGPHRPNDAIVLCVELTDDLVRVEATDHTRRRRGFEGARRCQPSA